MNKIKNILSTLFLLMAFALCGLTVNASSATAQGVYNATGATINEIRVHGTERIEPATVLTYLNLSVGDKMTTDAMDKALKNLFATGLFADVNLGQQGNILNVTVVENPVINEIAFEGNDDLEDKELLREIQLRSRQVFTRTKVLGDVNRLYQIYRRNGRFSASIDPKVIKLDQNRVNLVFEINEGPITKTKDIRFVGNKKYSDEKLRSVISTKEARWYRFMSNSDRYDPDRLSYDQELLRRFYLSQGYADFRVISTNAELSKSKDYFYITFSVDEGQRYKIGKVGIDSHLRNFDATKLRPYIKTKNGQWYNADEVQATVEDVTNALGDMQYAFVNVHPEITRHRDEKTVDISYVIDEAPRVFVERIDIRGNVRTLDKVIRREILMAEGDPFNRSKLAKSEQNIKDLNFFESVKITPTQGSAPDKTVLIVDVTEKSTGEMSVGAGFSTTDGPLADFSIKEHNLLGKGQDIGVGATVAGKKTEFNLSFTEPYFLDRDFSAGFDLFHSTHDLQDESSYSQKRTGGALRFGYPLSEHWRQSLRYRLENNEIRDVQSNASRYIKDQEGKRVTSAIGQRLTYDTRDSTLFPTNGLYSWLDTEVAGLGGDAQYVSGKIGASYYYPVYDEVVFNLLGETGAIEGWGGKDVQIDERYFIGGSTLRGFRQAGIGPRDTITGDSLGGNLFYRGSAELSFPIGLPKELGVQGHAFTDVGSLWGIDEASKTDIADDGSLRASAGVGISWRSPLGPIRVDLAAPYVKKNYDKTEIFRFNFGTRF